MNELKRFSNEIRLIMLDMIYNGQTGTGHIGSSLSIAEILSYLFLKEMKIKGAYKDYFVLSKGHAVPILYALYYKIKWITKRDIKSFRTFNSKLQGHPDKRKLKCLDAGSGALGQGLSISIGYSLSSRIKKNNIRSYCLIGDGEMQEGQILEGAMFASANNLSNLCVIIDGNKLQNEFSINSTLEINNIKEKWESFGFKYMEINGHDFVELQNAFNEFNNTNNQPFVIYANTIKGKGVSFMENDNYWHSGILKQEHYEKAIFELKENNEVY